MHNKKAVKKGIVIAMAVIAAGSMVLGGCGSRDAEMSSITSATNETYRTKQLVEMMGYDPSEYVKLPKDYMKMEFDLEGTYAISDEDIKASANEMLSYTPVYKETDKTTIENGDTANIDYEGKVDGEAFDGGTAEGQYLEIGSGTFIDGFEEQLIGMNVGEEKDITVTFPEDYGVDELNGKEAVFHVKLNSIAEQEITEFDKLTDDYVKENLSMYGVSTVDEFKSMMENQLASSRDQEEQSEIREKIFEKLKAESEITIPDGLLDKRTQEYIDEIFGNAEEAAKENGMSTDEFIESTYGESRADIEKEISEGMEDSVKEELILSAIVQNQKIKVDTADITSSISEMAQYYGMTNNEYIEELGGWDTVILNYARSQALETVTNAAKISSDEGTAEEEDKAAENAVG